MHFTVADGTNHLKAKAEEILRLKRRVAELKQPRDFRQKKWRTSRKPTSEVRLHGELSGRVLGEFDELSAGGITLGLLRLEKATTERTGGASCKGGRATGSDLPSI
jgi:hypothetical protein